MADYKAVWRVVGFVRTVVLRIVKSIRGSDDPRVAFAGGGETFRESVRERKKEVAGVSLLKPSRHALIARIAVGTADCEDLLILREWTEELFSHDRGEAEGAGRYLAVIGI